MQASVVQDGKDYHFSVVVPPGAVPGETVLTVPVPIPKSDSSSSSPPAVPSSSTQDNRGESSMRQQYHQQMQREQEENDQGGGGEDVIASFLMDRGIEPGNAIQAAMGLVSAGISTSSKLQNGNIGDIARASGLSGDDLRRVFDNRHPQVTKNILSMCLFL